MCPKSTQRRPHEPLRAAENDRPAKAAAPAPMAVDSFGRFARHPCVRPHRRLPDDRLYRQGISGASAGNILMLISGNYTKLVVLAFLVAAPVAYWLMDQWLQDFAYRIKPSVALFLLTGFGTWIVAILITTYHSLRAAFVNPVDILRDE